MLMPNLSLERLTTSLQRKLENNFPVEVNMLKHVRDRVPLEVGQAV